MRFPRLIHTDDEPVPHLFITERNLVCRQSSLVYLGCGADENKATGDIHRLAQVAASLGSGVSVGVCVSLRLLLNIFLKLLFGEEYSLNTCQAITPPSRGNLPTCMQQPPLRQRHTAMTSHNVTPSQESPVPFVFNFIFNFEAAMLSAQVSLEFALD